MSLSHTARLTYVLLLDRMTLSQKNGWVDVQGRAYVLYPLAGLAEDLQSSISSVTRALRELEAARKEETVVQNTLKTLLNMEGENGNIAPSSPLFINDSLPPKMEFILAVNTSNYLVNQLNLQEHIAKQQVKIDRSGYMPNIALFGKQTLYSHGIQSNLLPRTMVGVGFTWNLFDGLER